MNRQLQRHVCQVAFCAHDAAGLRQWYVDVFGLLRSSKIIFFPPSTATVQGIPGALEKCYWLVDQQEYFQLEFFQFWKPRSRLRPADWRPCDIGYNMLGLAVNDFDQVIRNVCAFSGIDAPEIFGDMGERRACVADPEGNLVEIRERDPLCDMSSGSVDVLRPEVPAVVRSMRISVPSLSDARKTYVDALGLQPVEDFVLHSPKDEKMWGLAGAEVESLLLRAGNFLVELVEYRSPQPAPWPEDYRICDQGFMNIALGYRDRHEYDRAFAAATDRGLVPNGRVTDIGVFRVMYVNDPAGFSIEMLYARKPFWSLSGFNPSDPGVEIEIDIDAPCETVWQHLVDHAGMGDWCLFDGAVLREGDESFNGPGCLRELTAPGMRITEEIVAWEEGHHYTYRLRTGAPFRWHRGDVLVREINGKTRVRWVIRFESWIPFTGKVTAWVLSLVFTRALKNLRHQLGARTGG
jgi:catechol 2,3-dioxygenase-like lactoylglutathione lyase family enzyme/uncharacterized protein YndB with AHSA1/START domain